MKKASLFFILVFFSCFAYSQATFQALYSGGKANDVYAVASGESVIVGYANGGAGSTDVALIKINSTGTTIWSHFYGGTSADEGSSVKQASDGGYIIAGSTYSFGAGNSDFYLIKTDVNGLIEWSKTYGGALADKAKDVCLTNDGGYVLTGTSNSYSAGGDDDELLIKTDSNGVLIWSFVFGTPSQDGSTEVKQTADNGFIVSGFNVTSAGPAGFLLKVDSSGTAQWHKTYALGYSFSTSVEQNTDGGYTLTGVCNITGGISGYIFLLKTNSTGVPIWSKMYSNTTTFGQPSCIKKTNDSGYIITGTKIPSPFFTEEYSNLFLLKIDSVGNFMWYKTFGGDNVSSGTSVEQTIDDGYIVSGYMLFPSGINDLYIIKTDSIGNSGCLQEIGSMTNLIGPSEVVASIMTSMPSTTQENISSTVIGGTGIQNLLCYVGVDNISQEQNTISVYPNPTEGQLNFLNLDSESVVEFFDFTGLLIYSETLNDIKQSVNLTHQKKGIYLYRIVNQKKETFSGKFILN